MEVVDDGITSALERNIESPRLPNMKRGEYVLSMMGERMGIENVPYIKSYYSRNKKNHPNIKKPEDLFTFLRSIWDMDSIEMQESMCLILLDRKNSIIGYCFPFKGGIDSAVVDIRIIMAIALESLAVQVVIAHNHPSGNLAASEMDIYTTRVLQFLLNLCNIDMVDHIIMTVDGFLSMQSENLLFNFRDLSDGEKMQLNKKELMEYELLHKNVLGISNCINTFFYPDKKTMRDFRNNPYL